LIDCQNRVLNREKVEKITYKSYTTWKKITRQYPLFGILLCQHRNLAKVATKHEIERLQKLVWSQQKYLQTTVATNHHSQNPGRKEQVKKFPHPSPSAHEAQNLFLQNF